jgi:hypothetical protein
MITFEQFKTLVNQYHHDTDFLSYHETKHPAYKELVSHGKDIIPFVLYDLKQGMSWLPICLLCDIVGADKNPHITEDMAGDYDKLQEAWLQWASDNGYNKVMVLF